jgi:site-specific DNA-adenine methylase
MEPKELKKFMKKKDNKIINFDSFSDDEDTKRFPPIVYSGGKQNHKTTQQSIVASYLLSNPEIDTYYEMFVGGFGSVYNSLPLLIEHGVRNVYLSDINKSLVNMYRQIQKNPKQVQRHLASIDLEHFKSYGKYHPETKEEGRDWFKYIYGEFSKLEKLNRMNPKRAAYFMYLVSNTQAGMIKYDIEDKTNSMSYIFDIRKLKKVPLLINKVEIYHQILNVVDMQFSVKKYENVHANIKDMTNILVLHDSPYAEFTTEKKKVLKTDGYNYGTDDFEQEPLLLKIQDAKYPFIYYNNHNPRIEEFSQINNFNYKKMDVEYANGAKRKKSIEILMYSNRKVSLYKFSNRIDFIPNKTQKIS